MAQRKSAPVGGRVELAELVEHVADQLRKVQARQPDGDKAAVMQFTEAEIELGVSIEKEASGGLNVWLLELGGGRTKANTTTLTVRFSSIPGKDGIVALMRDTGEVHDAAALAKRAPLKPPGKGRTR
jgi:Trypsin-co-occurring domain 2